MILQIWYQQIHPRFILSIIIFILDEYCGDARIILILQLAIMFSYSLEKVKERKYNKVKDQVLDS